MTRFREVENWGADELDALPGSETDEFEYKSSRTPPNDLAEKLQEAASAFWNSGGGYFVLGVAGDGVPDGGVAVRVGRQPLRDWVDQALARVVPPAPYAVGMITSVHRGELEPDRGVLVVGFGASRAGPHMSTDHRYYIRAGAHTVPAGHYLVEALRTHRGFVEPRLECLLRYAPMRRDTGVAVELVVVAVNDSPALEVHLDVASIPGEQMGFQAKVFPKKVPVIGRETPYVLRLGGLPAFHGSAFNLEVRYCDLSGGEHQVTRHVSATDQLGAAIY